MIVACSRGDGAVTNYEIARVTVALQHLRAGDDSWAPDRSRTPVVGDLKVRRRDSGTWPPRCPCSRWRTVVSLRSRRGHATPCLSIEGRFEDRAAKPCGTRPVPGEPGLTGVWPDLGLAGVPGRVTDSICPSACP